ncbi:uncharacterized protein LOC119484887 [Sebastes umbrosus]|uniref:uncharacterized protein LOC119484887 n=1 Tax=Sebastes umbrosus TaxID=72105 RepID=UPI00189F2B22|nr:uncharacterized protein LOC119484887 [Sebastes umbrosus]
MTQHTDGWKLLNVTQQLFLHSVSDMKTKREIKEVKTVGYSGTAEAKRVLTEEVEKELADHIKKLAEQFHGLTPKKCCELALELAERTTFLSPTTGKSRMDGDGDGEAGPVSGGSQREKKDLKMDVEDLEEPDSDCEGCRTKRLYKVDSGPALASPSSILEYWVHSMADCPVTRTIITPPATPVTHRPHPFIPVPSSVTAMASTVSSVVNPMVSSPMTDICNPISSMCNPTSSAWDTLRSTSRIPACSGRDPVSAAAHLHLLGESLSLIGHHLQETDVKNGEHVEQLVSALGLSAVRPGSSTLPHRTDTRAEEQHATHTAMSEHLSGSYYGSSPPELRLALLGNIGCGKTSSGDTILGQLSRVSPNASRSCQLRQGISEGRSLTVMEAPRWYWTGGKMEDSVRMETQRGMTLVAPGPHAILLLVPVSQFTEMEGRVPAELEEVFGDEVLNHTMVLLTCGDYLMGRTAEEYLQKEHPGLRQVIERCGGRYHVINNRQRQDREQVQELLEKVDNMVKTNGVYYMKTAQERELEKRVRDRKRELMESYRAQKEERMHISNTETRRSIDRGEEYSTASERTRREERDEVEGSVGVSQRSNGLHSTSAPKEQSYSEPHDNMRVNRPPSFRLNADGAVLSQMSEQMSPKVVTTFHHRMNSFEEKSPEASPKPSPHSPVFTSFTSSPTFASSSSSSTTFTSSSSPTTFTSSSSPTTFSSSSSSTTFTSSSSPTTFSSSSSSTAFTSSTSSTAFTSSTSFPSSTSSTAFPSSTSSTAFTSSTSFPSSTSSTAFPSSSSPTTFSSSSSSTTFTSSTSSNPFTSSTSFPSSTSSTAFPSSSSSTAFTSSSSPNALTSSSSPTAFPSSSSPTALTSSSSPTAFPSSSSPTSSFSPSSFASSSSSSSSSPELRLVLLGRSGSGKSAVGNKILGREEFESRPDSLIAITQECEKKKALVEGRQVAVVDTPNWFNSEQTPDEVRAQISSCVALSSPGPHAFLMCVPLDQPAKTELQALGALETVFGPEAVQKRTLLVFTYADKLMESGKAGNDSVEEYIAGQRGDLIKLVEKCGDRFHVMETAGGWRNRMNVAELLDKVDQTVKEGGGQCYCHPAFQEAENRVRERQLEIARERRRGKLDDESMEEFRELSSERRVNYPYMQPVAEAEEEVREDEIEETRDEAEMSVSTMNLESLPAMTRSTISPSLLQSIIEKMQSGAKMLPKLLSDGSVLVGEGAKKVKGSPVWGQVGSKAQNVQKMVADSSVWGKVGSGAGHVSKLVGDKVGAGAGHVSKLVGDRAPKSVVDGSAWVGSGAKSVAASPMWGKVGSGAKSGAMLVADRSMRVGAGIGAGAKNLAQSPMWGKVGSGAKSGAKLMAESSVRVGAGIGAGAKKVAQSPVWGKVGSGAKAGAKMVADSSVWEKIATNAKKVPMVVIGGALLGLVLGVVLGGVIGGAVGAAAGSAVTEVGRRKFGKKNTLEKTDEAAKNVQRAVNDGIDSVIKQGDKILKTE